MTAVVITAMLSPGKTHGSVGTDFGALKTQSILQLQFALGSSSTFFDFTYLKLISVNSGPDVNVEVY